MLVGPLADFKVANGLVVEALMPTPAEVLASVPLFEGLEEKERALLAERVDIMELKEGETLFDYGDPGDWMAILKSGVVELSVKTKTGGKVFAERAETGEPFGEISLLDLGTAQEPGEGARERMRRSSSTAKKRDLDRLPRDRNRAALQLLTATGKRLRMTADGAAQQHRLAQRQRYRGSAGEEQKRSWDGRLGRELLGLDPHFSITHIVIFWAWILLNAGLFEIGDFDPFPFGLLTMAVSLEAIILSTPACLFSSNRQTARDRVRGDIEYDGNVNLKAELQDGCSIHEKLDQTYAAMLARLDAIDKRSAQKQ